MENIKEKKLDEISNFINNLNEKFSQTEKMLSNFDLKDINILSELIPSATFSLTKIFIKLINNVEDKNTSKRLLNFMLKQIDENVCAALNLDIFI